MPDKQATDRAMMKTGEQVCERRVGGAPLVHTLPPGLSLDIPS